MAARMWDFPAEITDEQCCSLVSNFMANLFTSIVYLLVLQQRVCLQFVQLNYFPTFTYLPHNTHWLHFQTSLQDVGGSVRSLCECLTNLFISIYRWPKWQPRDPSQRIPTTLDLVLSPTQSSRAISSLPNMAAGIFSGPGEAASGETKSVTLQKSQVLSKTSRSTFQHWYNDDEGLHLRCWHLGCWF